MAPFKYETNTFAMYQLSKGSASRRRVCGDWYESRAQMRSLTCPNDERRKKLETLLEFFSEKVTQKMEEDKAFDQDTRFRARLYTPRYQVEKNCISAKTYNNLTKMVSGFFEFAEAWSAFW